MGRLIWTPLKLPNIEDVLASNLAAPLQYNNLNDEHPERCFPALHNQAVAL